MTIILLIILSIIAIKMYRVSSFFLQLLEANRACLKALTQMAKDVAQMKEIMSENVKT